MKYLNRSSNWVSSFSVDDAEKVSYKKFLFDSDMIKNCVKILFLAKGCYGSQGQDDYRLSYCEILEQTCKEICSIVSYPRTQ